MADNETPIPGTVLEEEVPATTEPVEPTEPTEPVEPTEPAEPAPEPAEPVEPEEPKEPVEPVKPSPREERRIQTLLDRLKAQQTTETPPAAPTTTTPTPLSGEIEADPATIQRLEAREQAARQEAFNQGVHAARTAGPTEFQKNESMLFRTRIEVDAPAMQNKYGVLNPNSGEYDKPVTDALDNLYLSVSGYNRQTGIASNPNLRYSEFVEAQMALAEAIAGQKVADTAKVIAKQAANTGIRPGGTAARGLNLNQAPGDMTDEELEAVIAQGLPKR